MTVKDKVGRRRYVVFRLGCNIQKPRKVLESYVNELKKDVPSIKIIQFKGKFGILHVLHFELEKARELLNAPNYLGLQTIVTAGTLRKAREILKKRAQNEDLRNR